MQSEQPIHRAISRATRYTSALAHDFDRPPTARFGEQCRSPTRWMRKPRPPTDPFAPHGPQVAIRATQVLLRRPASPPREQSNGGGRPDVHDTARRELHYIAAASTGKDRPLNEVSFLGCDSPPSGDERPVAARRRCVARVWQRTSPSDLERLFLSLVRVAKRDYARSCGLATRAGVLGDARACRPRASDCMTNATRNCAAAASTGLTFVATDAHD
jgi:hypothetical protein